MDAKLSVKPTNLKVEKDKRPNKDAEKKTERVKDRGDLRKINNSKWNRVGMEEFMPDRGDSAATSYKSTPGHRIERKKLEERRSSDIKRDAIRKEGLQTPNKTYLDVEGRKRLRERYTLRLKNDQNLSKNLEVKIETKPNDNKIEKKTDEESSGAVEHESRKNSPPPRSAKKLKEAPRQRKPIIKTVTVKNDNRVYKAVTFVDQKQHTPLQINIPNEYKKKAKEISFKLKPKPSKESVKEKQTRRKREKRKEEHRFQSPEAFKKDSPPTEVAKWAPSCLSHHTKPYYEAWVDTTLAAISKCSKKDRLYLKNHNVIQTFKKVLQDEPGSPELVYENYDDERYTGRIKVRR